jgi:para-aminobenzoate synthetase
VKDQTVTMYTRTLPRWHDPEQVFLSLYADQDCAFWLDSSLVIPGMSRYSMMGDRTGPRSESISYDLRRGTLTVGRPGTGDEVIRQNVFDYLQDRMAAPRLAYDEVPAIPFTGGFVGYFGYELKSLLIGRSSPAARVPDAWFILADRFVCFDHLENQAHLVCLAGTAAEAGDWFDETERRLAGPALALAAGGQAPRYGIGGRELWWSRERERYLSDVGECLAEITDGESYEICLTNKVHLPRDVDPLAYYLTLRRRNPAQYSAFLRLGEIAVACSSPECFLRMGSDRWVDSRPIKGTRELGTTDAERRANYLDLKNSEKDRAENLMIVDLVRNDLGRVCEVDTVHVPEIMAVERYATVWQMVSTVRGRLMAGQDAIDCVKACFPGGSMTGAPKIRTMEIIDRLEHEARGIYSGTIGYLGFDGAADLNIVIRTAVFERDEISIGVGGAIIALSDAEAEYFETTVKARALIAAYHETLSASGLNPRLATPAA